MKKPFSILTVIAAMLTAPLAADAPKGVSPTAKPKAKLSAPAKTEAVSKARAKAQGKAQAKVSSEGQAQAKARSASQAKAVAKAPAPAKHSHWVCPMHDGGESDKPGKCPKCGMDLIEEKS
jgi:hypothetical protein